MSAERKWPDQSNSIKKIINNLQQTSVSEYTSFNDNTLKLEQDIKNEYKKGFEAEKKINAELKNKIFIQENKIEQLQQQIKFNKWFTARSCDIIYIKFNYKINCLIKRSSSLIRVITV